MFLNVAITQITTLKSKYTKQQWMRRQGEINSVKTMDELKVEIKSSHDSSLTTKKTCYSQCATLTFKDKSFSLRTFSACYKIKTSMLKLGTRKKNQTGNLKH